MICFFCSEPYELSAFWLRVKFQAVKENVEVQDQIEEKLKQV